MDKQEFIELLGKGSTHLIVNGFKEVSSADKTVPTGGSRCRAVEHRINGAFKRLHDSHERVIAHQDGSFTVVSIEWGFHRFWCDTRMEVRVYSLDNRDGTLKQYKDADAFRTAWPRLEPSSTYWVTYDGVNTIEPACDNARAALGKHLRGQCV